MDGGRCMMKVTHMWESKSHTYESTSESESTHVLVHMCELVGVGVTCVRWNYMKCHEIT